MASFVEGKLGFDFAGIGGLGWRLLVVLFLFAGLCCVFFCFGSLGDDEGGGSEIVRLGGLTMVRREAVRVLLLGLAANIDLCFAGTDFSVR